MWEDASSNLSFPAHFETGTAKRTGSKWETTAETWLARVRAGRIPDQAPTKKEFHVEHFSLALKSRLSPFCRKCSTWNTLSEACQCLLYAVERVSVLSVNLFFSLGNVLSILLHRNPSLQFNAASNYSAKQLRFSEKTEWDAFWL
jgi:hypothetical protein